MMMKPKTCKSTEADNPDCAPPPSSINRRIAVGEGLEEYLTWYHNSSAGPCVSAVSGTASTRSARE